MRGTLTTWIAQADAFTQMEHFRVRQSSIDVAAITSRVDDYYLSLVGELFDRLQDRRPPAEDWARLGNALLHFASPEWAALSESRGVSRSQASFFSATAFYCGGYPASAYLAIQATPADRGAGGVYLACHDLMARPREVQSKFVRRLLASLRVGDASFIDEALAQVAKRAEAELSVGPEEWIAAFLLERLISRFARTNVRAVLPDGQSEEWNALVQSLLNRRPSTWEFFPSQIAAIDAGLLASDESFTLQMPTGAGKTTLAETLIYSHILSHPSDVVIMLVPYRSLASELRASVVHRLNEMGVRAKCVYGGTVPCGEETQDIDSTQLIVATPEALSGVLSAHADLFARVGLVICDEGHLLDTESRGVGLELLLARMKERPSGPPRFVFISAIVPNVEEINAWLGGSKDTVVVSEYRPSLAEFAALRQSAQGGSVSLVMHPQEDEPTRYSLDGFLSRSDFQWRNPATGRMNTYPATSIKAKAIAAARKSMTMGATVVYAANKRGRSGAIGLADELLGQLQYAMPLAEPLQFAKQETLTRAVEYLEDEFGEAWTGSRCLRAGAALHHGDIPQETREVVEQLVRSGTVRLAFCTSTLAEGVNLPIRTLVLYSVNRRDSNGTMIEALTRDIKNLVGRAGRPGSTTKGLVICANPGEWQLIQRVADQASGEPVRGALKKLIGDLRNYLLREQLELSNSMLEEIPELYALVDGIDATLIDLATEEIGQEALIAAAERVVEGTYAAAQMNDASTQLLRDVFRLRAERVVGLAASKELACVRESGTRARMVDAVRDSLLPAVDDWSAFDNPTDAGLIDIMFDWAWNHSELEWVVRQDLRLAEEDDIDDSKSMLRVMIGHWVSGERYGSIAEQSGFSVDDALALLSHSVGYVLQTQLEQAIALLEKLLENQGLKLSPAVSQLPEHLRFGVPTRVAATLAAVGVRHRYAAVKVGLAIDPDYSNDAILAAAEAIQLLTDDAEEWADALGALVWERTLADLKSSIRRLQ